MTCRLGVPAEERRTAQAIHVDLELRMDLGAPGRSDAFAETVDYAAVRDVLEEVAGRREYHLVESLAESMAHEVLARFSVPEVCITVHKPLALRQFHVDDTAIQIVRRAQ